MVRKARAAVRDYPSSPTSLEELSIHPHYLQTSIGEPLLLWDSGYSTARRRSFLFGTPTNVAALQEADHLVIDGRWYIQVRPFPLHADAWSSRSLWRELAPALGLPTPSWKITSPLPRLPWTTELLWTLVSSVHSLWLRDWTEERLLINVAFFNGARLLLSLYKGDLQAPCWPWVKDGVWRGRLWCTTLLQDNQRPPLHPRRWSPVCMGAASSTTSCWPFLLYHLLWVHMGWLPLLYPPLRNSIMESTWCFPHAAASILQYCRGMASRVQQHAELQPSYHLEVHGGIEERT